MKNGTSLSIAEIQMAQSFLDALDAILLWVDPLIYLMTPTMRQFFIPHCGNLCEHAIFRTLDRRPLSIFVPECGCPVHDSKD